MTVEDLCEALEAAEIPTLAQVLSWLPSHIAADFDCPDHGPHEFVEVAAHGVTWKFCKYCDRKKVIRPWEDMRLPRGAVVIGSWVG